MRKYLEQVFLHLSALSARACKIITPCFHVKNFKEFQITRLLIREHVMVFEQPFIVICYVMTSSYSFEYRRYVTDRGDINHVICFV